MKKKINKYRVKELTEYVKFQQVASITNISFGRGEGDIRDNVWAAAVSSIKRRNIWFFYRFQFLDVNSCFRNKAFKHYSEQRRKNRMAAMQKSS